MSTTVGFIETLINSLPIDTDEQIEECISLLDTFGKILRNQNIEKINEFRQLIEETQLNILVKRFDEIEHTSMFYDEDIEILKNFVKNL